MPQLRHDNRNQECAYQDEHGSDRSARGVRRTAEVRRQHDQDADEADEHRAPSPRPHRLAQEDGGEHHREQRRREADRRCFRKRNSDQAAVIAENRRDVRKAARDVTGEILRSDRLAELTADREADRERNEHNEVPREHHLAERYAIADVPHHRAHKREAHGRRQTERDAKERIHFKAGRCPTRASSSAAEKHGDRLAESLGVRTANG